MTDDLARLERLFHAALERPEPARTEYLEHECAGRPELLQQVLRMLRESDSPSLLSPARGLARGAGGTAPTEAPGSVIDRYKLLQVIGEGGFGVVYMAEQLEPVRRKVALKIIKLGMDTAEVIARFEAERQALAMMDHQNIAKILDGGATSSGRPYFVMELVRGLSITAYADQNQLSTQARLELFVSVCDAVQHAHQKGVIHRDLKPSNIMVTMLDGKPIPKVIDFGIAKAMHTRLTERTLFTEYQRFIGTPAYMSPEQAELSAIDVDTRTDIYALGAVLYELLTGDPPFDVTTLLQAGLAEVQRVIREEPPQRPSVRVSTKGTASARAATPLVRDRARRLRGDLDWIVMKALEKERGRRYGTASHLAADIELHLRREPVTAGPPSRIYRTRKFLARNRGAVVAATLVLLALAAGAAGLWSGLLEARRERESSETTFAFLANTLALANPDVAMQTEFTVRHLLDRAAERVPTSFADQPLAEARVRSVIGRAYAAIGALELGEQHLRVAARLAAATPELSSIELWELLWGLTNVCFRLDRDDSFRVAHEALAMASAAIGEEHAALGAQAAEFNDLFEQRNMTAAAALFPELVANAQRHLAADSPNWLILADIFKSAGYSVWYTENEVMAIDFWQEALDIKQRLLPGNHPDLGETTALLVSVLHRHDRGGDREAELQAAVATLRDVYGPDHWQTAVAESVLAENMIARREFAAAEELILRAHRNCLEIWDETNYNVMEVIARAIQLYDAWGKLDRAAPFRESLARTSATYKWLMPWSQTRLLFSGPYPELHAALTEIADTCGELNYAATPTVRAPELIAVVARARQLLADPIREDPHLAATLARTFLLWSDALVPEACGGARRVMVEQARTLLHDFPDLTLERAEALAKIASFEPDEAERARLADRAVALLNELPETLTAWVAAARVVMVCRALMDLDRHAEAEPFLLRALATLTDRMGAEQEVVHRSRAAAHAFYLDWGKPEEAARYPSRAPADRQDARR